MAPKAKSLSTPSTSSHCNEPTSSSISISLQYALQLKFTTVFAALVVAASAVSASPAVVLRPPITSPKAGDVWTVGTTQTVTWNTSGIPASVGNPIGGLLLGYLEDGQQHLDTENPLAEGFLITAGTVEVTVPQVDARDDYIVVLFGDSGDVSPEFTITQ